MYEINGRIYTLEQLEQAAEKYKMDFDSYLERMKEKGLKEVAESQEELAGDETGLESENDTVSESVSTTSEILSDFNWESLDLLIFVVAIFVIGPLIYFISLRKNKKDIQDIEDWLIEQGKRHEKDLDEPLYKDINSIIEDPTIPKSLKDDLKNNTINENLKKALLNTKMGDFRELELLMCKFYPDEAMIWSDEVEDLVRYKDIKDSTLFVDNDMNVDDSLGALAFLDKVKGLEKEKIVFDLSTFKVLDEKSPPFTDINGKWYNKFGNTIMRCVSEKEFEKELNKLLDINNIPKNSAKVIITTEMAEIIGKSGGIPENMEPIQYYEGKGFNIELPPTDKGKPKIIVLKNAD